MSDETYVSAMVDDKYETVMSRALLDLPNGTNRHRNRYVGLTLAVLSTIAIGMWSASCNSDCRQVANNSG